MTTLHGRAVLAVTERAPVRSFVTRSRAGRALSTRFVAGETLTDALRVARAQNARGASVSLDHLGAIAAEQIDGNISIKPTQLGLALDPGLALELVSRLATRAHEGGTTVSIDMEGSRHTEATVGLFEAVQRELGNVGVALQAALYRSGADLARVVAAGGHVRICKGAYAEPREVARQGREEIDAAFDDLARIALREPRIAVAIATHDGERIRRARELAAGREAHWELQMLYGVRPELQRALVGQGVRLRVYVPFGTAWYPYLTRRLAERPSNLTFFLRALVSKG